MWRSVVWYKFTAISPKGRSHPGRYTPRSSTSEDPVSESVLYYVLMLDRKMKIQHWMTKSTYRIECLEFWFTTVIAVGWNSSVGIATHYGMNGPGIESWWGRLFPHLSRPALEPPPPLHLLYNGYRVFLGGKASGAWRWPPTLSSVEVKERAPLYLYVYSPSGSSWPVLGRPLPLLSSQVPHLNVATFSQELRVCCLGSAAMRRGWSPTFGTTHRSHHQGTTWRWDGNAVSQRRWPTASHPQRSATFNLSRVGSLKCQWRLYWQGTANNRRGAIWCQVVK